VSEDVEARVRRERRRRRTFAIISHPDAGKTTLTEKLLLYGGAIHLAGSVRARKATRHATSDWMKIEQERGISVTSSVLQFEFEGHAVNLLDTPGHQDFSEDTYRTLTAADAAVMLIDAAKGVEAQTRKLFDVCRMRGIPIFTFINKLDRVARAPMDLMDELETVLGIRSCPMTWPVGSGSLFRGIYARDSGKIHVFAREGHGEKVVTEEISGFIFKIQANMDPQHRDRIAFLRVVSGEYQKDMSAQHVRLDKKIKLTKPSTFMARERSEIETAYPGDIIGLYDPGHFRIGDAITAGRTFEFEGIPQFAPEFFAIARLLDVSKRKQLQKGLDQLSQEGAIQVFRQRGLLDKDPIVGAVGQLQFDVLRFRMESEYNVTVELAKLPYDRARWLVGPEDELKRLERGDLAILVEDRDGLPMLLIRDEFSEGYLKSRHDKVAFHVTAPRIPPKAGKR
jgi:small GTP-binding protein